MAKWGQGDPRWIVEERPDAVNVNNWHWTEKNASVWSKDTLKSLLMSVKFDSPKGNGEITEVTSVTGEASANNRKAKLIFFYEWDIKLKWKAVNDEEDYDVEGKIEIPNLSEENDIDEVDVTVTAESSSGSYEMKQLWINVGVPIIKDRLSLYVQRLKQEFSQGMILPTASSTEKSSEINQPVVSNNVSTDETSSENSVAIPGLRIHTRKITMVEEFKCTAEDLFLVLTEKQRLDAFTRSDSQVEAIEGGQFLLFGGNITGTFVEVEPDSKIVQKWRSKEWPAEHYSTVTIKLVQEEDCTKLHLTQTGVPESDYERTQEGWTRYYWESIKAIFGFGARLF